MKKIFLTLFVFAVIANFAIAQQGSAPESAPSGSSILGIITGTGIVGILVWLIIFTMFPCAIILGIASIIFSIKSDGSKLPFTFKWLALSPVFYFFVGAIGVMYGMLSTRVALAESGSASSGAIIANGFATTIDSALFTLLGMVPFFFFILISLLILHFKKIPSSVEGEVTYE